MIKGPNCLFVLRGVIGVLWKALSEWNFKRVRVLLSNISISQMCKIKFQVNGKIIIARLGGKNQENFTGLKLHGEIREIGYMSTDTRKLLVKFQHHSSVMKWHVGFVWSLLELFLQYIKRYKQYTIRDDASQRIHGFCLFVCLFFFLSV